jgi:hypothetical protein
MPLNTGLHSLYLLLTNFSSSETNEFPCILLEYLLLIKIMNGFAQLLYKVLSIE